MKNPRIERLLFGFLLGLLLVVAWMDNSSETSAQMRAHEPWTAWLVLRNPKSDPSRPPATYLLIYHWEDRILHLIQMPETSLSSKTYVSAFRRSMNQPANAATPAADRALAQAYSIELHNWIEPRLCLRWTSDLTDLQSPSQVRAWVLSWSQNFRFWLALPQVVKNSQHYGNPKPDAYDITRLAWEIFRLKPENLRVHKLPADQDRAIFFSRIENAPASAVSLKPTTVEILNASGESGVALQATKILRWRGLDVVDFGNAAVPAPLTRFIDRTADYEEAARVALILGCGRPEIIDEMGSNFREHVTVILGQDFENCASLKRVVQTSDVRSESWN